MITAGDAHPVKPMK